VTTCNHRRHHARTTFKSTVATNGFSRNTFQSMSSPLLITSDAMHFSFDTQIGKSHPTYLPVYDKFPKGSMIVDFITRLV